MEWRSSPEVPSDLWRAELQRVGSPLLGEGAAPFEAARPLTGLALAMMWVESQYGTRFSRNRRENRNALNLRPPDGIGYAAYPTWADGVRAWRERITSPTDKGGVYARTRTVRELVDVYAPAFDDNDPGAYARTVEALLARWGAPPQEEDPTVPELRFGNVPHPPVEARDIPNSTAWNDLGPRTIRGVVLHRMIGTLRGTDGWFRGGGRGAGLTDYGVGVAGPDAAADDGRVLRWNDPRGRRAPWANGPVSRPYGAGAAFVARHGVDAVNRDLVSVEIAGNYDTPLTGAARASVAALIAYWADQARVPWDAFPAVPGEGRSFVLWHQEFTIGTGKICPGPVVMDATPDLIARARAILKRSQEAEPAPEPAPAPAYAAPMIPAWIDSGEDVTEDGTTFYACRRFYTTRRATPRRQHSGPGAPSIGPDIPAGEAFAGLYVYTSHGKRWVLTRHGTRVQMSHLTPYVSIRALP